MTLYIRELIGVSDPNAIKVKKDDLKKNGIFKE
jgi:hypothetical protein